MKVLHLFIPLLAAFASFLCFQSPAPNLGAQDRGQAPRKPASEPHIALVIGNGAYAEGPLANPVNDARDMAAALRESGFEVLSGENLNHRQMEDLVREFGHRIRGGGVGLFYFAGHGIQVAGSNYLIPIGAVINGETEVKYEAVDAGFVLAQMENARNRLNILVLDACRNNPFGRSFRSSSNGLASMDAPAGTLIAYATAPGRTASDGSGRNGLYTKELLAAMRLPGLKLEDVFKRTRAEVLRQSNNQQIPWEASSIVGDFYFSADRLPAADLANTPPASPEVTTPTPMKVAIAPISFTTAQVNSRGKIISQWMKQCQGYVEDLGNGAKLEMVEIPGGSFMMGAARKEERFDFEEPQHPVNTPSFWMGKFEVTQKQWLAVMRRFPADQDFPGDDLPVGNVSWDDAQEFFTALNRKLGLQSKGREYQYRLPSEAEWEYAARAGANTPFAFGEVVTQQIVNYDGSYPYKSAPKGARSQSPIAVGSLGVANAFGLFDMHGNMYEWCEDVYHENYNGAPTDGSAWLSGGNIHVRVLRGGSWRHIGLLCRSANRQLQPRLARINWIGFRVVISSRNS
jgi:formylglycine-generating enzyme required for sulfatase activity